MKQGRGPQPILLLALVLGIIKAKAAVLHEDENFIYKNLGPLYNHPDLSCNAIKCITTKAANTKGNK